MPDCTPGSDFDEHGVCSWCRTGFPNYTPVGEDKLRELLREHRPTRGAADCLVGVSGGKDSTYALLQLQREFGMKVEAFTYVHDGSTDFALENARRACRILGVRQHLGHLPEHLHIRTFRDFFTTWVETRDPLAAAMTCVACKHLHVMATRLARDRRIPMVIWSSSPLETPPFIPSQPASHRQRNAPSRGMTSMAMALLASLCSSARFCRTFLRYAPTCVIGSLAFDPTSGFLGRRYPLVKQVGFFEYCRWDGAEILRTVQSHLGWSVPIEGVTEWHSDCLFHVFKEYMFQAMYKTSYTDAFLSNQIRCGLLGREQAYRDLMQSKAHFADQVLPVLDTVGLHRLRAKIDVSCFDVK